MAVNGMDSMARTVKAGSGTVVVLGDPQGLALDPADCLLSRHASMASCTTTWSRAALWPYAEVAARAKRLGARFVDTQGWFCFQRRCPTVIGHTIVYKDSHHLTVAYSLKVAGVFRDAFLRAVSR
jgi:hypothetical protein